MKLSMVLAIVAAAASSIASGPAPLPIATAASAPPAAETINTAPPAGLAPPPTVAAAPVALLFDLGAGRTLYAHDADRAFLPASVTKVMTAFVAFDLIARHRLDRDHQIVVDDDSFNEWHAKGSRMFLARGSRVSVDQLLTGIMTVSANDGAVVLARGVAGSIAGWVALMNAEAKSLGMTESHFGTPNGWMDKGNTYVSARDLVLLADAMITRFPDDYRRYVGHSQMVWNGITQHNHDPTVGLVRGADGIKTGFTNEAHYNFLGSAQRDGRRLVMVVAAVPTPRERAKAARDLLEWGYSAWDAQQLFPARARVGEARVQGGVVASVALLAPRAVFATVPKGTRAAVHARIVYDGPLRAPIAVGAPVAMLEVRVGADPPVRVPLAAAQAVARAGVIDRLRAGLTRLLA